MSELWPTHGRYVDKVAVITGGTSGIGLATAQRLSAEGGCVVIAGRDEGRGALALATLPTDRARFVPTDVTDRDALERLYAETVAAFGRVDVVVNSAGAIVVTPFGRLKREHWQRTLAVNLGSVIDSCQAALPHLRAAVSAGPGRRAAIVNVASLDAVGGDKGMTVYSAAKAGVVNFTRSLALELISENIRVNAVSPGAVDTPMTVATTGPERERRAFEDAIPAGRFGHPEEIAAAIAFVAADEAAFMVGANLVVDGGVTCSTGHPDLLALFGMS
ncbi:MAG: SDR family oxidoreductase [Acidimicrobiales bacterium]|nr:SDR family oxidoreductase [Acidimicrobiales bacterium]